MEIKGKDVWICKGQTVEDLGCPDGKLPWILFLLGETPLRVDELGCRLS